MAIGANLRRSLGPNKQRRNMIEQVVAQFPASDFHKVKGVGALRIADAGFNVRLDDVKRA
jgi:hypothetical protein